MEEIKRAVKLTAQNKLEHKVYIPKRYRKILLNAIWELSPKEYQALYESLINKAI